MPRVCINKKKYMVQDFPSWVRREMRAKKIRQSDLARELGISQQSASNRLTGAVPFSYPELLTIFELLKTEPEDVLRWTIIR